MPSSSRSSSVAWCRILLLGRIVSVTQTMFYANADLRTPFISTVIYTIANTVFALVLARWLGVLGIGLAVSLASFLNATT